MKQRDMRLQTLLGRGKCERMRKTTTIDNDDRCRPRTGIVIDGRRIAISRQISAIRNSSASPNRFAARKSVAYLNVTGIQKLARSSDVNTGIFPRK